MDYKYELDRFVSVCRQLVNNTQVSTRPYGYLCGSKAAWGVFLNALLMYEKIFQQGESANSAEEAQPCGETNKQRDAIFLTYIEAVADSPDVPSKAKVESINGMIRDWRSGKQHP